MMWEYTGVGGSQIIMRGKDKMGEEAFDNWGINKLASVSFPSVTFREILLEITFYS